MSEKEIRVLYVQPGKYPEERTIPNTLKALQELVGGDIECCYPWRDRACVVCNSCGKIDGLTPNRMLGPADELRALLINALKNREEQYTDGHTLFVGKTPLTVLQNTEVL